MKKIGSRKFGHLKFGSLALFFIILLGQISFAEVNVTSTVQSDEVQLGVPFLFVVRVSTDESGTIEDPRLDGLAGMNLNSAGKSDSSVRRLMQTEQGMEFKLQRTVDFKYQITPLELGRKTIPSAEVKVGDKAYRTQPLLINVTENPQPRPQQNQMAPRQQQIPGMDIDDFFSDEGDEEDLFQQLLQQRQRLLQNFAQQQQQRGGGGGGIPGFDSPNEPVFDPQFRTLPKNPNEAFFVQVETDKIEVFEGEQVTVAWSIYTRGNMESLDRVKFPSLRGFWKEIIEEVPSLQFGEEIVNGVPYRKALLAAHALFPIKQGTARIDEFKIKARVRTPGQGWNQKANEYTKSSQSVSIKVKPLPMEGRPAEFSGAVGEFNVRARVEKPQVTLNQPFTLKIRIEGKGNAKVIDLPAMPLPSQLERYDTKSDSRFFKNGTSFKEFEVLLIPRENGTLEIPKLKIGFFNPRTAEYYIQETDAITLNVEGNADDNQPSVSGTTLSNQAPPAPREGFPPLRTSLQPALTIPNQHKVEVGVLFLFLSFFLGKTALISFGGARQAPLKNRTLKKFRHIEKLVKENNPRLVGSEVLNVIFEVVSEVTGVESSSRQLSDIVDTLPLGFKKDFEAPLTKVLRTFEEISFAPESVVEAYKDPKVLSENVAHAKELLVNIIGANSQV